MAELLNVDLIMVPTLACACAAYTPFSVNYDDEHRYVGLRASSLCSSRMSWIRRADW